VVTASADVAAGRNQGMGRQPRPELMMLTALPVTQLRSQAGERARRIREPGVRSWQFGIPDWHADRGGARPRAATFSASGSPSSCAEPMCSMFRDPRREDHTI
jgi:hypothetical protein